MLKLTISASSQPGVVRDHNEDAILVSHQMVRDEEVNTSVFLTSRERYVLAVCDGIGGHNAGEIASMDAVEQLSHRIDTLHEGLDIEHVKQLMKEWVTDEHEYLIQMGDDDPEVAGLGTTMVGLLIYEGHICWMNCGDSRLYRLRNGVLCQISSDHSLISLTHRPADAHVILNCLGGGAESSYLDIVDISDEVHEGDAFLLCSDGLTDMVSDSRLEELLDDGAKAPDLIKEACNNGGLDNVSVCLVSFDCVNATERTRV